MAFNLADILEATGKLAVTFDQHPLGAAFLMALAALLVVPTAIWLLRR